MAKTTEAEGHKFVDGVCDACGEAEVTEEVYTITYVLNGGTNNDENPETYTEGSETVLKNPTREGYVFLGWYTDAGFKTHISKLKGKSGDITLYAKWSRNSDGGIITPEQPL